MSWNQKRLYYEIVLPYSKVLEDLEFYGMRIDLEELNRLKVEFEDIKNDLEHKIYEYTGRINLRSGEQKARAVFGKLGVNKYVMDYRKTWAKGKEDWVEDKDYLLTEGGTKKVRAGSDPEALDYKYYSLDSVNCYKLRETTQHPIAQMLIDLSEVNKLLSSYVNAFLEGDSKGRQILFGDRVHPSYFAYTKGGRLGVQCPPVATIPSRSKLGKRFKKVFLPDDSDSVLVSSDYSGIELRFLAWLANEKTMQKGYKEKIDLHALTTSYIEPFNLTYEQAKLPENGSFRFFGKTTNFTLVYIGSYFSLQETFLKKGFFVNKKLCSEFEKAYFNLYKDVKPYHQNIKRSLLSYGFVENLWGRRRYFPGIKGLADTKENKQIIDAALRSATSHIISGSSTGDYVPLKSLEVIEMIRKKKFSARFFNTVHDSLMYSVKRDQVEDFISELEKVMTTPTHPVTIELPVDTKTSESWYGL